LRIDSSIHDRLFTFSPLRWAKNSPQFDEARDIRLRSSRARLPNLNRNQIKQEVIEILRDEGKIDARYSWIDLQDSGMNGGEKQNITAALN
jgi:hypothetical protein